MSYGLFRLGDSSIGRFFACLRAGRTLLVSYGFQLT